MAADQVTTTLLSAKGTGDSDGLYESADHAASDAYSVVPEPNFVPDSFASEVVVDAVEQSVSIINTDSETDPVGALVFIDERTPDYQYC